MNLQTPLSASVLKEMVCAHQNYISASNYYTQSLPVVLALSGPGGATVRTFDTQSGDLIAERQQHVPASGLLFQPSDLGAHITFVEKNDTTLAPTTDAYVLTNGHVIRRIDSMSGNTRWEWAAPDKVCVFFL